MSNRNKQKGTNFETWCSRFLQERTGISWPRQPLKGKDDEGDLIGTFPNGLKVVIECKAVWDYDLAGWLREADRERENASADVAVVYFKARGRGVDSLEKIGQHYVLMKGEDFARLLNGKRAVIRRPRERSN